MRGREQSASLLKYLENMHVAKVFCSPLRRARETLELLEKALPGQPEIQVVDALAEVDHPKWRGLHKVDLLRSDGATLRLWRSQPEVLVDHDGRSVLGVFYSRVRPIAEVVGRDEGVTLVIGHDHVNRAVINAILGWPINVHRAIPQSLSGLSLLSSVPGKRAFELRASNLHSREFGMLDPEGGVTSRLVIVRHGVTEANRTRVYQGPVWDPPLECEGVNQISRLAVMLSGLKPNVIVSSTLRRAVQSAELLSAGTSCSRRVDSRLLEFHYGRWSGLSDSEVSDRFPDEVRALYDEVADNPIAGGEPLSALFARVSAFLDDAWGEARGGRTVLVVAHDVVIRAIITLSLRLPRRCFWQVPIENGAMSELEPVDKAFMRLEWLMEVRGGACGPIGLRLVGRPVRGSAAVS